MSDRCELRKRNVSQGFQHLASMTDSEFESEFRKFLAKNDLSVSSLPSIDKSVIGKMDGGRRRKMKGGDCSAAMMTAVIFMVAAAIGTGAYGLNCMAGAEIASAGAAAGKMTTTYIKGLANAAKYTFNTMDTSVIILAYQNLAVLRTMARDTWHIVTPIAVGVKNSLVDLCNKLSAGKEKTEGGARRRRTYKKRGGARRGGSRCGMSGGKKRKSRGRKSRGRISRGRNSRGR